ncbi:hypothetical protein [carnivorous sponge associated iridovirus]|jgi:hypothetical protein|nr:hypothetical protein [carnivorous sponge associated iridovirus]
MIFKSLVPSVTLDNLYEYLDDIIDYYDQFKVFTSPFELMYPDPPVLNRVDRIYDATIEDDETTGDSLYNVSFRFIDANGVMYWAYAHMRINYGFNIDVEFYRGTMFVTKDPKIFFMTTMPSIDQTDDLYAFLLEDGLDICFDEDNLPMIAKVSIVNYIHQIRTP